MTGPASAVDTPDAVVVVKGTEVVMRDHVSIEMSDGIRLSARIWMPAAGGSFPALLEYLPYRKGDWTAARDAERHPYYAAHDYVSVRVDMRGCGDSEGVMRDEYTSQELSDAVEVIEWLARQPWCNGNVGMFGISWGGFNSLQVAALRPEPLKAIVTVCSTDDRFDNDVHYTGGAVLGVDMLPWATTMLAFTARPPDPTRVGARWQELWLERLDALEPFLDTWLSHQERDAYWRHGSVCEDYAAIQAAVLAVGGWADPYRDTVLRLVEHLSAPAKGIIGPWCHQYPDIDLGPAPHIGFLQETLRWWDRWLKGAPTGVEDDPALRVWLQDSVTPATSYDERPGSWVTEPSWPSPNVAESRFALSEMTGPSATEGWVQVACPQHTGIGAGKFFPVGNPVDLPGDQRAEDGRSVCFDTPPLDQGLALLGRAVARLRVRAGGAATITARLCDVAPDGASSLMTYGVLDLRRREGMDRTVEVTPGEELDVAIPLVAVGWRLSEGHRLRLAVSDSYWPWVWPYPRATTLELDPAGSALVVPARGNAASAPVRFAEPEQAPGLEMIVGEHHEGSEREVHHRVDGDEWELIVDPKYGGSRTFSDGLVFDEKVRETYTINATDPASARCGSDWTVRMRRPGWDVEIAVQASMAVDGEDFVTKHGLQAVLNGDTVRERSWERRIPRPGRSSSR